MAASGNNHLIRSEFTARFYEEFASHVENSNEALESEEVDKLAMLSIICHDLKLDGVAYQEKFFRLLQHPNALGTEIHRTRCYNSRPNSSGFESRPRYSKSRPPSSPNFMFTWPSKAESASETYISIPMRYWSEEHREESIVLCCILYLLLADVAPAFSTFRPLDSAGQEVCHNFQIDCPCLLAYFFLSPEGNKCNFKSFLSEYVAMLQICFKKNFCSSGESSDQPRRYLFMPVTSSSCDPLEAIGSLTDPDTDTGTDTDPEQAGDNQVCQQGNSNDFYIELSRDSQLQFSVKAYNHRDKPSWFSHDSGNQDRSSKNPFRKNKKGRRPEEPSHSPSANNILVLNCRCETCWSQATVHLEDADKCNEDCPRKDAKMIVIKLYREGSGQECHYVTSAWRFFQLRYALQGFGHAKFQSLSAADGKKLNFYQKVVGQFRCAVDRVFPAGGYSEDAEKACLKLLFCERG